MASTEELNAMELKSLKSQDLHTRVQQSLKEYFVSSGMKPGDPLPTESALATSLGVSRTAIREGLRGLEALGILEVKPGVGRFLKDFNLQAIWDGLSFNLTMSIEDFKQILDVRMTLENAYLQRELDKFTQEDIDALSAILEGMQNSVDRKEERDWVTDHAEFHLRLYQRSNNPVVLTLIRLFANMQVKLVEMHLYKTRDKQQFIDSHRELLEAIKTKDKESVREALMRHFEEPLSWKDGRSTAESNQ